MKTEETLTQIFEALSFDTDESEAKAYGITEVDDNLITKLIISAPDIYDMLESMNDDRVIYNTNYDYVSIISHGWAAPLDENGEIRGAPSKHPEKRRVRLIVNLDVKNSCILGSTICFDKNTNPEDLVHDTGEATGSLRDAVLRLIGK